MESLSGVTALDCLDLDQKYLRSKHDFCFMEEFLCNSVQALRALRFHQPMERWLFLTGPKATGSGAVCMASSRPGKHSLTHSALSRRDPPSRFLRPELRRRRHKNKSKEPSELWTLRLFSRRKCFHLSDIYTIFTVRAIFSVACVGTSTWCVLTKTKK